MIATASSGEKRALALELGADVAIDPDADGLTERLIEANGGGRWTSCFEMAGGEVFDASYAALAPFGRIVVYGIATQRAERGSGRARCCATRARSSASTCSTCLRGVGAPGCSPRRSPTCSRAPLAGELRPIVGDTYPLEQAPQAQIDLRERRTTGKLLLDPTISRMTTTFAELGLSESTLHALHDVGYESPSPIQEQAIPALLAGPRRDRPGADRAPARRPPSGCRSWSTSTPPSRRCRRSC